MTRPLVCRMKNVNRSVDTKTVGPPSCADPDDRHLWFTEGKPWQNMLLRMIALRLSIASIDSPLWVNVLWNRFDRFKKCPSPTQNR